MKPGVRQRCIPWRNPAEHSLVPDVWQEKRIEADLFAFLDSLPPDQVGRGAYLVTTNIRNEKQFWKREQIEPYKPVIVVGLDDEKKLFRLGVFYRANQEYSWKTGPQPPMMTRPLGAFIYFLKEPPDELRLQAAQNALTVTSFRRTPGDPLGAAEKIILYWRHHGMKNHLQPSGGI